MKKGDVKHHFLCVVFRDCLMKTNPYVVVHCLKALTLSIVRQPFKFIFIKGPVSKLHIKFTAFYKHLSLKVPDFSKVLSLPCGFSSKAGAGVIFSEYWFLMSG